MKPFITLVILVMMTPLMMSLKYVSLASSEVTVSEIPRRENTLQSQVSLTTKTTAFPSSMTTSNLPISTFPKMTSQSKSLAKKSQVLPAVKSPKYAILGVAFVVFMMISFFILSNINNHWYPQENTEELRENVLEAGLVLKSTDPTATLEIPSYELNTSRVFYLPGYGKQLSVVREDSQEVDY